MQSDPIDIEALVAPLAAGEQGAGVDLRADYSSTSLYQRLRDARSSARADERARDAEGDSDAPEAAGWSEVLTVGQLALSTQSKDLEVAAWMTEALVRIQGLPGLTAGARLIATLCNQFWDSVFPLPDEEGMSGRSLPIGGLAGGNADGTVMQPLRRITLFRRADTSAISLYLWDQAEQTATMDDKRRKARYDAGAPELKTLEAEARLDKAYLTGVARQTLAAIQAFAELEPILDARFGAESPSLRNVSTILQRMLEVATRLGAVITSGEPEGAAVVAGAEGDGPTGTGAAAQSGPLVSRESALGELDRIAEFFRRTEPHSPLAYTLDEAVRRGRMTLPELLAEILPDASVRNTMLERLGIKPEVM